MANLLGSTALTQCHDSLAVGIIMDGNGRWAENLGAPRTFGHLKGAEAAKDVVRAARDMGVNELYLYAFALANLKRAPKEIRFLMHLIGRYIRSQLAELHAENIQFRFIGNRALASKYLNTLMDEAEELTRNNTGMKLIVAINYSGSWDIANATKLVAEKAAKGEIDASEVNEDLLRQHLSTAGLTFPQIIIRTGMDINQGRDNFHVARRSDFLTFEGSQAVDVSVLEYFPSFTPELLEQAIASAGLENLLYGGQRSHRTAAE